MTAQETQGGPKIAHLCLLGGVSRASYYRHFEASAPARADTELRDHIQQLSLMLMPAINAIQAAQTPDEVRQALVDAWPDMDTTALEDLMGQAYFVADLVGRDSVVGEAAQ